MSQEPTTPDPTETPILGDVPENPRLTQPIRANAMRNTFHFWKFTVIGLAVFGFGGLYFLYDGLVAYPAMNARAEALDDSIQAKMKSGVRDDDADLEKARKERKELTVRSDFSIQLQWLIGAVCTPIGLGLLIWHFRNIRGSYLLENDVLALPNGDEVELGWITSADTKRWWGKGLATYEYEMPDKTTGKFKLDALCYEPKPSDGIAFAIADKLGVPVEPKPVKKTATQDAPEESDHIETDEAEKAAADRKAAESRFADS